MIITLLDGVTRYFNASNANILEIFPSSENKLTVILSTDSNKPKFFQFSTEKERDMAMDEIERTNAGESYEAEKEMKVVKAELAKSNKALKSAEEEVNKLTKEMDDATK